MTAEAGATTLDEDAAGEVTRLLRAVAEGDHSAENRLIPLVYGELRRLAGRYMRSEAPGHTLQATALVHEAYLRLVRSPSSDWQSRSHFFAVAATIMRRILVDSARARRAEKRGGPHDWRADALQEPLTLLSNDADRILSIDSALERLAALDERQCKIVELRYFAGMTVEEVAQALDVSPRTVKREWQLARAWLYGELSA
jgi:RNA polymerase sigma factor (TIGR02999 family)